MNFLFVWAFFCLIFSLSIRVYAASTWTSFTSGSTWPGHTAFECVVWTSGILDQNVVLERDYNFGGVPYRIDYSYRIYFYNDCQVGEYISFYMNEVLIRSDDVSGTTTPTASCTASPPIYKRRYKDLSGSVTTSPPVLNGSTIHFSFTNGLLRQLSYESWALYNLKITYYLCDSTCDTCDGEAYNQCLTCPVSPTRRYKYTGGGGIQCVTSCPAQGPWTAVSDTCVACVDPNCEVCSTPDVCTKCKTDLWYLTPSFDCGPCFSTCQRCSGPSSAECTLCKTGYHQFPQTATGSKTNFECLYPCPARYATITVSGRIACVACTDPNCITCAPQGTCYTCDPGWVAVSGSCLPCSSTCATCTGTASSQCTSCPSNRYISGFSASGTFTCVTSCSTGYKPLNGECVQCADANCISCSAVDVCATCATGYYLNAAATCTKCYTGCSTCISNTPDACTNCATGYKKVIQNPHGLETSFMCNATCSEGYAVSGTACVACTVANCVLCPSAAGTCTKCASGLELLSNKCYAAVYMEPIGLVGNNTLMVGFTEAFFEMMTGDPTTILSVSVTGKNSGSDYSYTFIKSDDNMTLNVTFAWYSQIDTGTLATIYLTSPETVNETLMEYYYYMHNSQVEFSLAGHFDSDLSTPKGVANAMNIMGPIAAGLYVAAVILTSEGSLALGGAAALEISLLNRAFNVEYPENMQTVFLEANNPPIPFFFPLTLEKCGYDPLGLLPNTFPNATNLKVYFLSSNFLDNTFRDLFTITILLIALGIVAGIMRLMKGQKGFLMTGLSKLKALLGWNIIIFVGMGISLRSLYYIFLNLYFPSLSDGFGVTSYVFAILVLITWFPPIVYMIIHVNRRKVSRIVDGRTTKKQRKRGKFDILYEEFLEKQHIRKFYMPVFFIRNLCLAFSAGILSGFPLYQAIYSVMMNASFAAYVIIARPWTSIINFGLHFIFDVCLVINSILVLAIAILDYQGYWYPEYRYSLGAWFNSINLVMIIVNVVAGAFLNLRAVWKWCNQPRTKTPVKKAVPIKESTPMTVKELDEPQEPEEPIEEKGYLRKLEKKAQTIELPEQHERELSPNDMTQLTNSIIGLNNNTMILQGDQSMANDLNLNREASSGRDVSGGRESAFKLLESFVVKRKENLTTFLKKR